MEEKYKILIVDDEQSILDMLNLKGILFILPAMRQRLWINYLTRRT